MEQNTQPFQLRIQFFRTAIDKALVFEVIHGGDMDWDGSNRSRRELVVVRLF